MADDFKPGLEGVVAVETEIAEPDREGGVLRYRGIDITELVGHYPYENVWGLLVDNDLSVTMPEPEPYEPVGLTGNAPADLQAETARLAGRWKLGKLNEISDEQAREDLGRLSAQMMGIVARSARIADGKTDEVPHDVVAQGKTAAEQLPAPVARRGRPEGREGDRHLLDLHRRARPERLDLHRARRRLHRRRLRRGALVGGRRALGPAARRRARVREADARGGRRDRATPRAGSRTRSTPGKRIMGFGHRIYRAEDPRSRILKETARELGSPQIEIAERLEEAALAELERRHPERPLKTNVEYYSAVVLDIAEIPPPLAPAMFACSRVAGWSAHILEQKRTGRLFRPNARYVGPGAALAQRRLVLLTPRRGRRPGRRLAEAGDERELADLRREWEDEVEGAARSERLPRAGRRLPRDRAVPLPPEDRAPPARARRREPGLPRLGADLARAALARRARAPSTRRARCSTGSRPPTTTRPCAGSRSSA